MLVAAKWTGQKVHRLPRPLDRVEGLGHQLVNGVVVTVLDARVDAAGPHNPEAVADPAFAVRGTIRESTFSRDKYLLTNHIESSIGRIKLKNLNALHLQSLYRERLDLGLSGSTV
jgi:hypothetical protein